MAGGTHLKFDCSDPTADLLNETLGALALNGAPGPPDNAMWGTVLKVQSQEPTDSGQSPDSAPYEQCSLEQITEPL